MAIFEPDVIASNALLTISNADLLTLGLLMSSPFNVWNRAVSGRLKSDMRISAEITYHNYPYPVLTAEIRSAIETAAGAMLASRAGHEDSTLADLYGSESMPRDLRVAHDELDSVVLGAYGLEESAGDELILSTLFVRYQQLSDQRFF